MKKLKVVLLLLAMIIALISFTACSISQLLGDDDKKHKENDEEDDFEFEKLEVEIYSMRTFGHVTTEYVTPQVVEPTVLDASELSRFELSQTMVFEIGGKSYECEYSESEIESLGSHVSHKYTIQGEENKNRYICVNGKGEIIKAFIGTSIDEPKKCLQLKSEMDIMFESMGGWNDLGHYTFEEQKLREIIEIEMQSLIDFSKYNCFHVDQQDWGLVIVEWWYEREGIIYGDSVTMSIKLYPYNSSNFPPDFKMDKWFSVKPWIVSLDIYEPFANDPTFEHGNIEKLESCRFPNESQIAQLAYNEISGILPDQYHFYIEEESIRKELSQKVYLTTYENRLCLKVGSINMNVTEYTSLYFTLLIML